MTACCEGGYITITFFRQYFLLPCFSIFKTPDSAVKSFDDSVGSYDKLEGFPSPAAVKLSAIVQGSCVVDLQKPEATAQISQNI